GRDRGGCDPVVASRVWRGHSGPAPSTPWHALRGVALYHRAAHERPALYGRTPTVEHIQLLAPACGIPLGAIAAPAPGGTAAARNRLRGDACGRTALLSRSGPRSTGPPGDLRGVRAVRVLRARGDARRRVVRARA